LFTEERSPVYSTQLTASRRRVSVVFIIVVLFVQAQPVRCW